MNSEYEGIVFESAAWFRHRLGDGLVSQKHEVFDEHIGFFLNLDVGVDRLAVFIEDELHLFGMEVDTTFLHSLRS